MIGIIDYGLGNFGSVLNMLKKLNAEAAIVSRPDELKAVSRIILPGVGAFDAGMKQIEASGLRQMLEHKALHEKVPTLGICLGMHLMTCGSDEGTKPGLAWISARVRKFSESSLRVPHMGWNSIHIQGSHPLLQDLPAPTRFYFVHSYHLDLREPEKALATTEYGYPFPSIIAHENLMGVQFHPEKSHRFGLKLLENFTKL